jgi:hypothetical protein
MQDQPKGPPCTDCGRSAPAPDSAEFGRWAEWDCDDDFQIISMICPSCLAARELLPTKEEREAMEQLYAAVESGEFRERWTTEAARLAAAKAPDTVPEEWTEDR